MKKITALLIFGCGVITACMIYIIRHGVSLRLEPIINPTELSVGDREIAKSLILRLTKQFESADYLLIGRDPSDVEANTLIQNLISEYQANFHKTPMVVSDLSKFENCSTPCWLLTTPDQSNELEKNEFITVKLHSQQKPFFTLTILNFDRNTAVSQACESEKRVTRDCVVPLAISKVKRKLKQDQRYFFAEGYFEQDYFLFLER